MNLQLAHNFATQSCGLRRAPMKNNPTPTVFAKATPVERLRPTSNYKILTVCATALFLFLPATLVSQRGGRRSRTSAMTRAPQTRRSALGYTPLSATAATALKAQVTQLAKQVEDADNDSNFREKLYTFVTQIIDPLDMAKFIATETELVSAFDIIIDTAAHDSIVGLLDSPKNKIYTKTQITNNKTLVDFTLALQKRITAVTNIEFKNFAKIQIIKTMVTILEKQQKNIPSKWSVEPFDTFFNNLTTQVIEKIPAYTERNLEGIPAEVKNETEVKEAFENFVHAVKNKYKASDNNKKALNTFIQKVNTKYGTVIIPVS